MTDNKYNSYLKSYEIVAPEKKRFTEHFFTAILTAMVVLFSGMGLYFRTVKPLEINSTEKKSPIQTQFIITEKQKIITEEKKVEKKTDQKSEEKKTEKKIQKEPVDLTKDPVLNQDRDDIKKENTPKKKKVRRVYGLKKVYSTGIGSGGSLSDAVIGKMGNTLATDIDTITATQEDIKGEVVSTTTVTAAPRFKRKSKPEYSKEMLENKIEGTIQVKVLVDIDGKVKKAVAMNDLGFGSRQRAINACFEMLFEPARRDDSPVAVWIMIPIRFVLTG